MPPHSHPDRLGPALGWASLALGIPPLARPSAFTTALGIGAAQRHRVAASAVGARELAAAAGLLIGPRRPWLWARVVGDAMDLGLLAVALVRHDGRRLGRTVAATVAVAGIAAVDVYAATRSASSSKEPAVDLTAATTVLAPPEEVYAFWRELENLPTFMAHVDRIETTGERTSRWTASAPFGRTVEWEAQIVEERPGELLAWRSLDGADVPNEGSVRFARAPGDRGTEVHVSIRYDLPAGPVGKAVARYFGEDPHQQVDDDLRRFKQVLETGEVVRSDGAPGGKRARSEFPQRPARPMTDDEFAQEVQA